MKNLIFFLLATIILVACDGCDPINPPIEKYTVAGKVIGSGGTINPAIQTVEKGGSATFHNIPEAGYNIDYLKDDGNILPAIDIYTVRNITKDDSFEVAFKKDSIMFPLLRIKWIQNGDFAFIEGEWYGFNINFTRTFSFNQDGTYQSTLNSSTLNGTWSLNRNVSPMTLSCKGMHPFTVETLNEKEFSIYYTGIDGVIYKYIFIKLGDK